MKWINLVAFFVLFYTEISQGAYLNKSRVVISDNETKYVTVINNEGFDYNVLVNIDYGLGEHHEVYAYPSVFKIRANEKKSIQLTNFSKLKDEFEKIIHLNVTFLKGDVKGIEEHEKTQIRLKGHKAITHRIKILIRPNGIKSTHFSNKMYPDFELIESAGVNKIINNERKYITLIAKGNKIIDIEPMSSYEITPPFSKYYFVDDIGATMKAFPGLQP